MSISNEIQRLQTAKADIKTAIEEKGVEVGDGLINTYAEKVREISVGGNGDYEQGYEDGKNSVVNPLEYAKGLRDAYNGVTFPDDYEMTLVIPNVTDLYRAFSGAKGIKKITIKHNNPEKKVTCSYLFNQTTQLEILDLTEFKAKISGGLQQFLTYSGIIEILGEVDLSGVTDFYLAFNQIKNLVRFTPKPNSINLSISFAQSPDLDDVSIQAIVDGLADLTGQTEQTLTVHKTVGEKLTDEQKATITAKNWTLAY